ncbi:MAG: MCE family protein [Deltaproteobacteria bacterium]|nr:MCE family protein [Deltaproteobacteria bacterium]
MPSQGRSLELRVGIFVALSVIVGTILVFSLGNRSALFSAKRTYISVFSNVDGLRPGSPIRMSGLDVGTVGEVRFQDDGRCEVELNISEENARFITATSVASIGSKGLLGDKLVEVTPGTGASLPSGATIQSAEGGGLFGALASAGELVDDARPAIANVRLLTETFAEEQFRQDLRDITHNIAELTRMAREEDGTVRRLLTDPELADRLTSTLGSVQLASAELSRTSRNVRLITDEIATGDGTVHRLIYDDDGARLVESLADTAGEAATILRDVRTGDGNMHDLLYGDEAGDLISNLTAMSADLRVVMADIRAGRGTIGGLLADPSIYEDIRRIVGNVERNDILRALVRYSIREDEAVPPAPRAEPEEGN